MGGTGYDVDRAITSEYTAYHGNTCPSHSQTSLYGKYMGIMPQDESGRTLITHCPHSNEGITRTGSSVEQQPHSCCNTGSAGGVLGSGGTGRHVTCYFDCGNSNDKI